MTSKTLHPWIWLSSLAKDTPASINTRKAENLNQHQKSYTGMFPPFLVWFFFLRVWLIWNSIVVFLTVGTKTHSQDFLLTGFLCRKVSALVSDAEIELVSAAGNQSHWFLQAETGLVSGWRNQSDLVFAPGISETSLWIFLLFYLWIVYEF